jgi:hypothetical protein
MSKSNGKPARRHMNSPARLGPRKSWDRMLGEAMKTLCLAAGAVIFATAARAQSARH